MTLSIGTPPQTFLFLPDSGSNDFTVQSTLLPPELQSGIPIYDPTKSSTSHFVPGYTYGEFFNNYNDTGVLYTDVVTIGGVSFSGVPICTMNHASSASSAQSGDVGLDLTPNLSTTPGSVSAFLPTVRAALAGKCFCSWLVLALILTARSWTIHRVVRWLDWHRIV